VILIFALLAIPLSMFLCSFSSFHFKTFRKIATAGLLAIPISFLAWTFSVLSYNHISLGELTMGFGITLHFAFGLYLTLIVYIALIAISSHAINLEEGEMLRSGCSKSVTTKSKNTTCKMCEKFYDSSMHSCPHCGHRP